MWVAAYIIAIVWVNYVFAIAEFDWALPYAKWETLYGPLYLANVIVGFVFVLRDYAQRQVGHYVLLATIGAAFLTYFVTSPNLALFSAVAFICSELTDWAVYSFTKKPLQQRILLSSLISVPADTFVFQYLYFEGSILPAAFTIEILSKAVGVLLVWYLLRMRIGNQEMILERAL